jgi:carboxypeptidase PM20D1
MLPMRKVLLAMLGVLVVLAAVVLVRAARFGSRQVAAEPVARPALDEAAAAARLAGALRFRTISHQDPAELDADEMLGLHRYLEQSFPRVHATLQRELVGGYSLLYTWTGSEPALRPLLLLGHIDVVPVEPGTEESWTHPPFEGRIAEGFVWGRGAWDDKSGVLGALEALELLLAEGFRPRRTVLLAFGHDEEVGGHQGAAQIAALLAGRGVEPELVLDEGLMIGEGFVPGIDAPVAMIGMAEKGSVSVELLVEAPGGHSSVPPPQTAIGILAEAVRRLERKQMPARLEGLSRQTFEYLGPEMSFLRRIPLANLWLFAPLLGRALSASPPTNASIRTTTAVTMIEGGVKENVLPARARAVVNFRIRPGDSVRSVLEHVHEAVADPRVRIAQLDVFAMEPSGEASTDTPAFGLLQRTVRQILPEAVVAPALVVGATDARHYTRLTPNVYRFLPLRVRAGDVARFHGRDERVAVQDYAECVVFFRQLVLGSDALP